MYRATLARGLRQAAPKARPGPEAAQHFSVTASGSDANNGPKEQKHLDVEELLSQPTWSVASLLPSPTATPEAPEVSAKQLHHLLRLSALPPPKDTEEETKMLSTLSTQLHFVKEIQKVDTTGIEPLRSLRDETAQGEKEAELGLEAMRDALAQEEVKGKHYKRIRRKRTPPVRREEREWDVLGTAARRVGRSFVVEGGRKDEG